MRIYPVPGRTKRDPRSYKAVSAEGREVSDGDIFWLRALRDGDVTTEAPKKVSEPAEKPVDDEEKGHFA